MIIFGIVLFHELGHVFIAKVLGYKILDIEIFPFGGVTKVDKNLNDNIYKDLLLASFGIVFQLFIHIFCIYFGYYGIFYSYNISIMFFNLLPIIPLDGSKIVFEILNKFYSYKRSLFIYIVISFFSIIIYILFNFYYLINNYLIIGLFLMKTIEVLKERKVIFQKFILERYMYNLKFSKVKNKNEEINNYLKDTKYYYFDGNRVYDEKKFLEKLYKL